MAQDYVKRDGFLGRFQGFCDARPLCNPCCWLAYYRNRSLCNFTSAFMQSGQPAFKRFAVGLELAYTPDHWQMCGLESEECYVTVDGLDNPVPREEIEANARLQRLLVLLEQLESLVGMPDSVSANWENGNLAESIASLSRVAQEAKTVIAEAR